MNHLSLFSGIGGLDIAAEAAGFRTVAFVERDSYCRRVLRKHWPEVPIFGDVREVSANPKVTDVKAKSCHEGGWTQGEFGKLGSGVTIISGGFPCQPHSVAGKRQASGDERDLWDECTRITDEFKPRWAVFENVPGLLTSERGSFFARVLDDLASLGYSVGWGVWGAVDVGAPHRRDRIFIVAHSERERGRSRNPEGEHAKRVREPSRHTGYDAGRMGYWRVEPGLGRVAARVPNRAHRLRALGNAVVPHQAYPIFKAIAEIEGL